MHGHIKELRNRLFLVAGVFLLTSSVAYAFRDTIIAVLLQPLGHQTLTYLTPGGGFSFIFKVTMWCGLALMFPFLMLVIYQFVMPALPKKAQAKSAFVLIASLVLFAGGAAFGYFYAIPGALKFLLTFADTYVQATLTADSYINFVLAYTAGLGVLFQIPLLLIITNWITPLKPGKLFSFERYVIVVSFVLAAIVTPTPDVVNQVIIALPIILMYQIGVFAVMWSNWRSRQSSPIVPAAARQAVSVRPRPAPRVATAHMATPSVAPSPQSRRSLDGIRSGAPTSHFVPPRPRTPTAPLQSSLPTPAVRQAPRKSIDGVSFVARPQL
jgi:sec-independent protein translocase protein TatC